MLPQSRSGRHETGRQTDRQTDRLTVTPLSRVTAPAHVTMPSGTKSDIILCAFSSHGPREIGTIIRRHPDLLLILKPFFEGGVCWTQARERIGARAERQTGPIGGWTWTAGPPRWLTGTPDKNREKNGDRTTECCDVASGLSGCGN